MALGTFSGIVSALTAAKLGAGRGQADREQQARDEEKLAREEARQALLDALTKAQIERNRAETTKASAPGPSLADKLEEFRAKEEIKQRHAMERARYNKQNPSRSRPSGGAGKELQERVRRLNTQIDDARANVTRLTTVATKETGLGAPNDLIAEARRRLPKEQRGLDSLTAVRDSLEGVMAGQPAQPRPDFSNVQGGGSTTGVAGRLRAKDAGGPVVLSGAPEAGASPQPRPPEAIVAEAVRRIVAGEGTLEQAMAALPESYHAALVTALEKAAGGQQP